MRRVSIQGRRLAVAIVLACTGASLQAAGGVPESLRKCAGIADASERLQCYDRAMASLGAPVVSGAAVVPSAAVAAAPVLTPEEKFGARGEVKAKQQPKAEEPTLERLTATVKALRRGPNGELVVTLENGQVWRQLSAQPMMIKVGESVSIRPMTFNSFWMVDASGRGSRVKRIQ